MELDDVVLWISQILVRHVDVRNEVSFNLASWSSVPPPSTRTRDEALALARQIAERAASDPKQFPELAREYSEDLRSRDEGGSLGGVQAAQLADWPQVLDALAAVRPGQSSQVVETRYGFHVFYRSAPVPDEMVSGAHIIVGHQQAQWLQVFARDKQPNRSREEALALATDLYQRARSAPRRFAQLVKEYSEHRDAMVEGDFGSWSTREPSAYPLRMKRLRELAINEVGKPIETHLGFEIIQRTPSRPRQQYRAQILAFPYDTADTEAPSVDPFVRAEAFAKANALAELLIREPGRFDEVSSGASTLQWADGRGISGLSAALEQLRPGQATPTPVDSEHGFLIARRLEPEPVRPSTFKTELPAPVQPNLEHFIGAMSSAEAEAFLRTFGTQAQQQLELAGATAEQFRALHDLKGRVDEDTAPEMRLKLFASLLERIRNFLGEKEYARYQSALRRSVTAALLEASADSPAERGL